MAARLHRAVKIAQEILFSWSGSGKSNELDFFADGTYDFQFTSMSVTEKGTWAYSGGKLSVTTQAGKEYAAELSK